jgi:hypothetical protein
MYCINSCERLRGQVLQKVAVHNNYSAYLNAGMSSTCHEAKLQKAVVYTSYTGFKNRGQ